MILSLYDSGFCKPPVKILPLALLFCSPSLSSLLILLPMVFRSCLNISCTSKRERGEHKSCRRNGWVSSTESSFPLIKQATYFRIGGRMGMCKVCTSRWRDRAIAMSTRLMWCWWKIVVDEKARKHLHMTEKWRVGVVIRNGQYCRNAWNCFLMEFRRWVPFDQSPVTEFSLLTLGIVIFGIYLELRKVVKYWQQNESKGMPRTQGSCESSLMRVTWKYDQGRCFTKIGYWKFCEDNYWIRAWIKVSYMGTKWRLWRLMYVSPSNFWMVWTFKRALAKRLVCSGKTIVYWNRKRRAGGWYGILLFCQSECTGNLAWWYLKHSRCICHMIGDSIYISI